MCLKFRPRLLCLSSKASLLDEQERDLAEIQTIIVDVIDTNRKGRQFWSNNYQICVKFRPDGTIQKLCNKAFFVGS